MLTVHHLEKSQSERVVWLCEELGLDYRLITHARDRITSRSPDELRNLHPIGAAPVITDGSVVLAESGAIMEYITSIYGGGHLTVSAKDKDFAHYLYWLHFTNGTLQPAMGRRLALLRSSEGEKNAHMPAVNERLTRAFGMLEARLGKVKYLAGSKFTVADIMICFTLTTMQHFLPMDLSSYPQIGAYVRRLTDRPSYRSARAKADPTLRQIFP